MAESVNKPKQMAAYDQLAITSEGYIPYDDNSGFDEENEIIGEIPLQNLSSCDYCSTGLLRIEDKILQERSYRDYCLWYCQKCRFWQARVYSDPFFSCMPPLENWAYVSKLREFKGNLPECCDAELAAYIRRHPDVLHRYPPTRFEKLVADVFRANYVNAEVLHVGKPKDGGIDVRLIEADKEQWLIQVKRRESQNKAEGVSTIRDMLGAMMLADGHQGIVVSTAPRFSREAQSAAAKARKRGMTVRLVDRGIFEKMLDPILPDRPWLQPISQVDSELAAHLAEQIPSDKQLDLFTPYPLQTQNSFGI